MSGASAMPTTGRWGWYRDADGVEKQRMSSLLKHVETDTYHLDLWKKRQVLVGAAQRDDLIVAAKAIGRPGSEGFTKEQKGELNKLVKIAEEAAKDTDGGLLGTALHTATERLDRGEPLASIQLPYPYSASLAAYEALRRMNGWRSVEIERTVWLTEQDVRGTFDRVDEVPGLAALLGAGDCQYGDECDGHDYELPVVVDVKTEAEPWRNGLHIAPQLAGYSRGKRMYRPEEGRYVDAPCVRQDVAIVVHVRDGDAVPYFVNLAEGWDALLAAVAQRERVKRANRDLGVRDGWFAPLPDVKRPIAAGVVAAGVAREAEQRREAHYAATFPTAALGRDAAIDEAFPLPPADQRVGVVGTSDAFTNLIALIWQADNVDTLAALWQGWTGGGGIWSGPVATAGDARRRQIECVQRYSHGAEHVLKCACGWLPAVRP